MLVLLIDLNSLINKIIEHVWRFHVKMFLVLLGVGETNFGRHLIRG